MGCTVGCEDGCIVGCGDGRGIGLIVGSGNGFIVGCRDGSGGMSAQHRALYSALTAEHVIVVPKLLPVVTL